MSDPKHTEPLKSSASKGKVKVKMKKHQKNSGSSDTLPKRRKLDTDDGRPAGSSTAEVETEAQPSYQSVKDPIGVEHELFIDVSEKILMSWPMVMQSPQFCKCLPIQQLSTISKALVSICKTDHFMYISRNGK
uniref:Uncharacterized protein n=1 Tax=Magallana gigas TaxID=29159 RepID=K1PFT3_MAGGI